VQEKIDEENFDNFEKEVAVISRGIWSALLIPLFISTLVKELREKEAREKRKLEKRAKKEQKKLKKDAKKKKKQDKKKSKKRSSSSTSLSSSSSVEKEIEKPKVNHHDAPDSNPVSENDSNETDAPLLVAGPELPPEEAPIQRVCVH
jgi:Skp family chaperone for outer membrane proteins